jgi:hypothetical protein
VFLGPSVVLAIGGLLVASRAPDAVGVMAFGLFWGVLSCISYSRSVIGLRQDGLVICAGFPLPRSYRFPLDQIEAVQFYQPALGSMLDFGKVVVRCGRNSRVIRFVSSPAAFVAEVRQRIDSAVPLERQSGGDREA